LTSVTEPPLSVNHTTVAVSYKQTTSAKIEMDDLEGNFDDFEDEGEVRELTENPKIETHSYADSGDEKKKTPRKKKSKKNHGTDFKVYDAGDDTDEELSNLKHDISEAPPLSARNATQKEKEPTFEPKKNVVVKPPSPNDADHEDNHHHHEEEKSSFMPGIEIEVSPSNQSVSSNSTPKSFKKKKKANVNSDPNDAEQIAKLKEQNQELKMQLLELNNALDEQLSKKGVKIEKKRTVLVTSDKEMKNLMKQVEMYKKENEEMKRQLHNNDSERIIQLENKVMESKKIIDQINEERKSLQNVQRKQGKALEDISSGNDKTIDTLKSEISYLKAKNEKLREKITQQAELMGQKGKMLEIMENKVKELETIMKEANVTKEGLVRLNKLEKDLEEKNKIVEEEKKRREIESKAKASVEKKLKVFQQVSKQEAKKLQDDIDALKIKLEEKDRELRSTTLQLKNNSSIAAVLPAPRDPSPVKSPTTEPPKSGGSTTSTTSKIPKPSGGPKSADSAQKPPKPAPSQQQRQPKVPTRSKSKIPSGPKKSEGNSTPTSNDPTPRMKKTEEEKSTNITTKTHDEDVMEDMDDDFIEEAEEDEPGEDVIEEHILEKVVDVVDPIFERKPGSGGGSIFKPMF
jgi:myosin heavy subunit